MAAVTRGGLQARRDGEAWLTAEPAGGVLRLAVGGPWDMAAAPALARRVADLAPPAGLHRAVIDLGGLAALDTAGAVMLARLRERLQEAGLGVAYEGLRAPYDTLLAAAERRGGAPAERRGSPVLAMVERVGRTTVAAGQAARDLLGFFGVICIALARVAVSPRRLRLTALVSHMERTGLNALGIVGLLSFLIGVVLAFQGADQLRRFGAEIFVVNLLGISVLREIGVLMTAIIVAGRSGAAFTAEIGTMKVNQEVDALRTLGLDPVELLVLPRLLALVLTLPLLAFFADVVALLGGALMAWVALDISLGQFVRQLETAVGLKIFFAGLVKAPVFAFVIAMVGCYEGLQVTGSAESVGQRTTKAVVEAIFLVIVIDAIFSILLAMLGT